jgi:hypothetical protein
VSQCVRLAVAKDVVGSWTKAREESCLAEADTQTEGRTNHRRGHREPELGTDMQNRGRNRQKRKAARSPKAPCLDDTLARARGLGVQAAGSHFSAHVSPHSFLARQGA